jgi:competence ComEA-like helix-hairpin-helix protein
MMAMSEAPPPEQKPDAESDSSPVNQRLCESLDRIVDCVELLSNDSSNNIDASKVRACDVVENDRDASEVSASELDSAGGEQQSFEPTGDGVLIDRPDILRAVAFVLVLINLVTIVGYWRLYKRPKADIPPGPQLFKTDVNSAPASELSLLPGVGYELANRIVESRQTDGPYQAIEDLRRVRGIGPKTIRQIEPMVVLGSATSP